MSEQTDSGKEHLTGAETSTVGNENKSNQTAEETDAEGHNSGPTLFDFQTKDINRRDYLKLGASAAALGSTTFLGSAAAGTQREGISFDTVIDAVDDAGMDPNGNELIDSKLRDSLRPGTLIEFPAGTYKFQDEVVLADNSGMVGVAGDRSKVRFVPTQGTIVRWLNLENTSDALLKDFTIDRRDDYRTSAGIGGSIERNFHLKNIEYDGWTPSGAGMFKANVSDPDGKAIIDGLYRTGPTQFRRYPESTIDIWSGRGHKGHMVLRNVEIHNGSESGIYTGKGDGTYLIENCFMKNVVHTAIRAAGRDTTVRNCTVVMDINDWDPRNEKVESTYNSGEPIQLNRGIWVQSADKQFSGPVIEDCDVIVRNAYPESLTGIDINFDTGGADIRNTRVHCDSEHVVPIKAASPNGDAGDPLGMELDGVSVTGSAWDQAAMYFTGRPNSVIRNCCIQSPNDNDGIWLDNCDGTTVENTNINVGGRSTTFRNGRVTTSGITSSDSCPLPSIPNSTPSESETSGTSDDSTTSDGTSSSDSSQDSGSSTSELPYRFKVESTGGGRTEFTVSASGTLKAGENAEATVENGTVTDGVGPEYGTDSYLYDGYITDFSVDGKEHANYYIETSDGSKSNQVSADVLSANTIVVKSLGGGKTTFTISVDGTIARGASGLEDTVDAQTASGRVGPEYGTDAFHYTGSITNLDFEGAEYATVLVNGTEIDPKAYTDGSADSGTSDSSQDLPNTLVVDGSRSSAAGTYTIHVTGDIEPAPDLSVDGEADSLDSIEDEVFDGKVAGVVETGADGYRFSGDITKMEVNGDAIVNMD